MPGVGGSEAERFGDDDVTAAGSTATMVSSAARKVEETASIPRSGPCGYRGAATEVGAKSSNRHPGLSVYGEESHAARHVCVVHIRNKGQHLRVHGGGGNKVIEITSYRATFKGFGLAS